METLDSGLKVEVEATPKYDAIVVLGRGIGKDPNGQWKPLTYFVESSMHSGTFDNKVDPDNEKNIVGGGNANTLALFHFYRQLSEKGFPPGLVIFAAGRPDYLAHENPDLSEGSVMRDKFLGKLETRNIQQPKTVILDKNKNTADDMAESLRLMKEKGLHNAIAITVSVQIERAEEFLKLAREHAGISETDVNIDFKASEGILEDVNDKYKKSFKDVVVAQPGKPRHLHESYDKTKAYQNTEAMEKRGVARLKAGTYFTTGPYAPKDDKKA